MATISESRFKFYMDMYWMEKRRGEKSVTAKECQLLHLVLFVCLCFCMYGKWFSVFMEQSGMGSTEFSNQFISIWKESFQQLLISVPSLEHGLSLYACAVWSLVFACPRTSVCTCVDLSCESSTTWSGFEHSDWSTNYPNGQSRVALVRFKYFLSM